jgi:hypothetical protein
VYLNNDRIKEVTNHKHLGIILSQDLKWKHHIAYIIEANSFKLNLMKKLKWRLDRNSLETIFRSFIRPSLEYGNVLYNSAPKTTLDKLSKFEIEVIRIICGATANCSRLKLCQEYNCDLLESRRTKHVLILFYKIDRNYFPKDLSIIANSFRNNNKYTSRNKTDYITPACKSETYLRSFFPKTIKLWNTLSKEDRNIPNLSAFKNKLKPKCKKMEILYYGERWPAIHHARIRMCCSKLNSHLHNYLHVIDNPNCSSCSVIEDPFHFFFECNKYNTQRRKLFDSIANIRNITLKILLEGSKELTLAENQTLFKNVHSFLIDTKRFT